MENEKTELPTESTEAGFALVEVLASILIMSVISLGVAMNLMGALKTAKFTEVNHAASSLAISKMEELASIDVSALDSSYDKLESTVPWEGLSITFTRDTSVVVNADESRTVDVVVTSNSDKVSTEVEFSTTFATWE